MGNKRYVFHVDKLSGQESVEQIPLNLRMCMSNRGAILLITIFDVGYICVTCFMQEARC